MANKKYTDFLPAITPIPSDILLQADPSTSALTALLIGNLQLWPDDVGMARGMGSGICAATKTNWFNNTAINFGLSNQQILFVSVYLRQKCLVTAIAFVQRTQGVYTANNFNGLGIYHISGSNFSQVGITNNNATLFKAVSNTFVIEPLSSNVTLDPGVYFIALLYNRSAQTTAPEIAVDGTNLYSTTQWYDVPSNIFPSTQLTGKTTMASSYAYSTLARQSNPPILFLYGNPV